MIRNVIKINEEKELERKTGYLKKIDEAEKRRL